MRNTIRLTENQLHRVIKESVKRVISELKASTYLDAADKAYDDYGNRNIPSGKRQIRNQQHQSLKDYGAQKDREERGISPEEWEKYDKWDYNGLSRRALKACDAHKAEMEKRK